MGHYDVQIKRAMDKGGNYDMQRVDAKMGVILCAN